MKTPIDIVSGFLGAGKTTLINHMLSSVYKGMKIAIIENEFGDINIDSDLLPNDITIKEISNGCVCCTMRLNLISGINELIKMNRFDRILIEPTGVAKLSDMLNILKTEKINDLAEKGIIINVINPIFHSRYSKGLGDYYLDQIENSDVIYINRCDKVSNEMLLDITADIEFLFDKAIITKLPANILSLGGTFSANQNSLKNEHKHRHGNTQSDFSSTTLNFNEVVSKDAIKKIIGEIIKTSTTDVLRIKGTLKGDGVNYLVQWVPYELHISESNFSKNKLVIIKSNISL